MTLPAFQPDLPFTEDLGELLKVWDPNRIIIVLDHVAPAADVALAEAHKLAREFARKFGITHLYDVGRQGVAHEVVAENGFLRPGGLIACPDSHTATSGAFNCAGRVRAGQAGRHHCGWQELWLWFKQVCG